eukprot:scaffold9053_cov86-Isochrysis_galbana.AAC.2
MTRAPRPPALLHLVHASHVPRADSATAAARSALVLASPAKKDSPAASAAEASAAARCASSARNVATCASAQSMSASLLQREDSREMSKSRRERRNGWGRTRPHRGRTARDTPTVVRRARRARPAVQPLLAEHRRPTCRQPPGCALRRRSERLLW